MGVKQKTIVEISHTNKLLKMRFFSIILLTSTFTKAIPFNSRNIQQNAFGMPLANPGNSVNSFFQNRFQVNQQQAINPYLPISSFTPNFIQNKPDYSNMTFEERFEYCDITSGEFDDNIPSANEGVIQDQVRVILILDETGSMGSNKENTIQAYNQFLNQQKISNKTENSEKNSTGEAKPPRYSLVKFDIDLEINNDNSILNSGNLNEKSYLPSGSTALLDAMGCTIQAYKKEMFNILVILTDGEENSSYLFKQNDIKKMIENMTENQKWQVQYLGANQDAFSVASNIGISNAVGYRADEKGFEYGFKEAAAFSNDQRGRQYDQMMSYNSQNFKG